MRTNGPYQMPEPPTPMADHVEHATRETHVGEISGVHETNTTAALVRVNVGASTTVEIDKLYGPWVTRRVRVRMDEAAGTWIFERLTGDRWDAIATCDANVSEDADQENR